MLSCQEGFQLFGDDAVEDGCFGISAGISVEQFKKEAMSRVPLGEMVEPEEVANLVAFLTAEAGGKITAQAISICGGSTQA